jgi:hypothetical protein
MYASTGNPDAARRERHRGTGAAVATTTTDQFLGATADQVMANHGPWVQQGFDAVARALKVRAETLYASVA